MQQPSLVLKAVLRAAEAGSDIGGDGGDTIMVSADVTSSNAGQGMISRPPPVTNCFTEPHLIIVQIDRRAKNEQNPTEVRVVFLRSGNGGGAEQGLY